MAPRNLYNTQFLLMLALFNILTSIPWRGKKLITILLIIIIGQPGLTIQVKAIQARPLAVQTSLTMHPW